MTDVLPTGKTILSLCDYTGNWPLPYREAGYNVIQVDLKFGQDVRLLKVSDLPPIHGILAAPPCTEFACSGARWWARKGIDPLLDGLSIVDACLRIILATEPAWWVLENPVGRLRNYIGEPAMIFHPCHYGDAYTKKTLLWGKFNTDLPRNDVEPVMYESAGTRGSYLWAKLGGGSERTKEIRSTTPLGFARAFMQANP